MQPEYNHCDQKIDYARAALWAPFYTVGMAARIQGSPPIAIVKEALRKLQILYPPLASRVRVEKDGAAWLTTEGVGEYPLEVRPRISDDDWAGVFQEQERVPFNFGCGPVARFFLLRGEQTSDLIAILPHVVCDGHSTAHVMWDAVALMNNPDREVTRPLPPPTIGWQTVSHSVFDNLLLRGLVRVVNSTLSEKRGVLRQEKYEEIHQQYWSRQQQGLLSFGLSPAETANLAARCRKQGVSVSGALMAAFILAQNDVRPAMRKTRREITVAVNIRDRLVQIPGRASGAFSSSVDLVMPPRLGASFWELARMGHTRIHRCINNRAALLKPLVMSEVDPSIADALMTAIATDQMNSELRLFTRFFKVTGESRCLNFSNIGRIDLPDTGAPYHLTNLLPFPPLVPGGGMVLNVLTVNGQMNMILKFRLPRWDGTAAGMIRDRALDYLLEA
jgi:hypothetical protein